MYSYPCFLKWGWRGGANHKIISSLWFCKVRVISCVVCTMVADLNTTYFQGKMQEFVGEWLKGNNLSLFYYFLDFTQLNRDCHWLILGHVALTKIKINVSQSWYIKQCTPLTGYITYSKWSKHGGKWHDRRREKHCQFSFREWTQQHKHKASIS